MPAFGQDLTLDTVFSREPPWGRLIDRVSWSPDGQRFLYVRRGQDPDEALPLMLYDVGSGASHIWLHARVFGAQETPEVLGWSADGARIALVAGGALYVRELRSPRLQKVSDDVDDARWAPRGAALAYSHNADLYVASIGNRIVSRRVTTGGRPGDVLHASLDWVYPEELGIEHAFYWSPDGRRIAYLTMDERRVTNFPIVDFMTTNNAVEHERYPLAGQANPRVALRVLDLESGRDRMVYDASRRDEYIAAFDWIAHSSALQAEIVDRPQQTVRFYRWANPPDAPTLIYYQASPTWVDVQPLPFWLRDGRSIWLLDRGPTAGIFLRSRDGSLQRLTATYRVTDLYGIARATIYVRAAYPTRRERSVLAVALDGRLRNLTPEPGSHTPVLAPGFERFVDTSSRFNDPPKVRLRSTLSAAARTLVPEKMALKDVLLPARTFTIASRFGPLDATVLFPPAFNPAKRYPAVMYVYGGPDWSTTGDSLGILYHQLLARAGIIVFSVDGPGSQVDNDEHERLLYRNFGPGSLLGQEIGARYIASLPYVDAARIGIWGWSFGGFETCYALTHSRLFAAGAAVAPVTDWHLYDSIYAERYMGKPAYNGNAYARSSVLNSAGRLNGPLLIQHGTADDNVHMANTIRLLQQFILAHESRVQFYPYPSKAHAIRGLPQQRSIYAHMLDFWRAVFFGRSVVRG
ncbi:MAG: S9 family peptidase [Candidatus Eremiobacteraeota bacterium]|nr:S9 family peptidase [Candidatus Eremiobacteraeota bacterium]